MDWTKLLFQIFNTAIMVFILYRLLFKGAMRVLDERSQRVTSALDKAEQREREAAVTYTRFQERLTQIQEKIVSLRQEAKEELWRSHKRILSETRHELETMQANSKRDTERARQEKIYAYQCELGHLVMSLSEHLIRDAGGASFQQACIAQCLTKLSELPSSEYRDAYQSDHGQKTQVRMVSSCMLDVANTAKFREQAQRIVDGPINVIHKVDPALIAGMTLYVGDRVIDGSVAGFLHSLYEQYAQD